MNLKLAGALVAATAAISLLAGCPGVVPGTQPSPQPTAFTFDPNAVLTGEVTFGGQALGEFPNWEPVLNVKTPGGSGLGITTPVQQNRYFQFVPPAQNLTEGTVYQVIWDYAGATPSAAVDFNTIDVYVSEPATASKAATDPMVRFDVQWNVNPSPTLNATASPTTGSPMTFSFNAIPNLQADYQVSVFSATGGSALWSSAPLTTATTVNWNGNLGSNTNNPTGAQVGAGNYTWNVKFWKKGGTYLGSNFYGETLRIPFTIQR